MANVVKKKWTSDKNLNSSRRFARMSQQNDGHASNRVAIGLQSILIFFKEMESCLTSLTTDICTRLKDLTFIDGTANLNGFEFRKVGISKALALPLFCDICDSSIFKFIEKDQMNLYSYPGFVLLNYRVTCAEQRKKQIEAEVFQRTLNAKTLKGNVDAFTIEKFLYGYQLGIRDLDNLKDIIKKEIESPEEIFRFEAFRYPLTKVYGAALFGTTDENTKDDPERFEFDDIFIHVIPFQDNMGVLCGYIKKFETDWTVKYVNSWREINESDLKVRLTDLFAARIENWGIAPSLFESIPKKTISKMIDFWDTNVMSLHKSLKTDFNFFE